MVSTRFSIRRTHVVWTLRGSDESCTLRENRWMMRDSCIARVTRHTSQVMRGRPQGPKRATLLQREEI